MQPVREIYKKQFFGRRDRLAWRVPIVCDAVQNTFNLPPQSGIIDVGCAIGDYIAELENRGYVTAGIEGSQEALPFAVSTNIFICDLRIPIVMTRKYDLCICLEVAEHIEEEYADQLVDNLCDLSDLILISAAPPGQGGHHHVNCQPKTYWIDKFAERNFFRSTLKEDTWKKSLGPFIRRKEIACYYNNIMVFRRG
jgi:2-polyprenyl-3-methyl-5-hydroxy-6-metoxy-1,4-benzoquinol methylase